MHRIVIFHYECYYLFMKKKYTIKEDTIEIRVGGSLTNVYIMRGTLEK